MANSITIVGKLAHQPVLLTTPSTGKSVTNFLVEVERPFKNSRGETLSDFVQCVAWKQIAEVIARNGKQGTLISVQGRVQRPSLDKPMEVVVEHFRFLGDKK